MRLNSGVTCMFFVGFFSHVRISETAWLLIFRSFSLLGRVHTKHVKPLSRYSLSKHPNVYVSHVVALS